jgi:hypothetical protein
LHVRTRSLTRWNILLMLLLCGLAERLPRSNRDACLPSLIAC